MGQHSDKPRSGRFLSWNDILPWQRDNEFILSGYRAASFSYSASARSILYVHNETANIWSHLLGALLFAIPFTRFPFPLSLHGNMRAHDAIVVGVYVLGVVVCFVLSTSYHTFSDHSPHMRKFGNELDHLGIVLVMWGTGVSGAHFGFYCHRATRDAYIGLLTAAAVGCGIFTLRPKFRQPSYRLTRFLTYAGLGASLFAPIVHGLVRFGWTVLDGNMDLASFFGLALINFSGAAVYAARVPERWFPATFDLLGHSHNWMHVLVLTGALVRLSGLLVVASRWQQHSDFDGFCRILSTPTPPS